MCIIVANNCESFRCLGLIVLFLVGENLAFLVENVGVTFAMCERLQTWHVIGNSFAFCLACIGRVFVASIVGTTRSSVVAVAVVGSMRSTSMMKPVEPLLLVVLELSHHGALLLLTEILHNLSHGESGH